MLNTIFNDPICRWKTLKLSSTWKDLIFHIGDIDFHQKISFTPRVSLDSCVSFPWNNNPLMAHENIQVTDFSKNISTVIYVCHLLQQCLECLPFYIKHYAYSSNAMHDQINQYSQSHVLNNELFVDDLSFSFNLYYINFFQCHAAIKKYLHIVLNN